MEVSVRISPSCPCSRDSRGSSRSPFNLKIFTDNETYYSIVREYLYFEHLFHSSILRLIPVRGGNILFYGGTVHIQGIAVGYYIAQAFAKPPDIAVGWEAPGTEGAEYRRKSEGIAFSSAFAEE